MGRWLRRLVLAFPWIFVGGVVCSLVDLAALSIAAGGALPNGLRCRKIGLAVAFGAVGAFFWCRIPFGNGAVPSGKTCCLHDALVFLWDASLLRGGRVLVPFLLASIVMLGSGVWRTPFTSPAMLSWGLLADAVGITDS